MIFCMTFLRALAALIITNSHYTGVYPTDIIANGGLLGDVIFFAVSGFCLYNVKLGFGKWFLRRVFRVYPAPIIITAVYMLIGFYPYAESFLDGIRWFIFPTYYHFVASILVLYIPLYFVLKYDKFKDNILLVLLVVFVLHFLVYIFAYDTSYYHIDNVREPMIRFIFFESMLLGIYFRQNYLKFRENFKVSEWVLAILLFVLYFISKMLFARNRLLSDYQILNQVILIVLLYFVIKCFISIDIWLEKLPHSIKKVITFISEITLEIYVVQYALIPRLNIGGWPVNWLLITGSIFVVAVLLHLCVKSVNKYTDKFFQRCELNEP